MSDQRTVRFLVISNVVSWLALFSLALVAWAPAENSSPVRIEAQRIDIVGRDGQPVMTLANKHELPGPIFEGREFPPEMAPPRPHVAGMIFYNDSGDEVGGLIYNGIELDSGYTAVGHLSLDQWRQNQVVALQYLDNGRTLRSGLRVWDRPTDAPLGEVFDHALAFRQASPAGRDSLRSLVESDQEVASGTERLFLGSEDRVAKLEIRDPSGRVRIRLGVGDAGQARLEFLDEAGEVVAVYPAR